MKSDYRITLVSTFLLLALAGVMPAHGASDPAAEGIQAQQQRLEALLDEIDAVDQRQAQQARLLKQLQHNLQCKWTLLQGYDTCQKQYTTDAQGRLACASQARSVEQTCLTQGP